MRCYVLLFVIFCVACGEKAAEQPVAGPQGANPESPSGLRLVAYKLPEEHSQVRMDGNGSDSGWRRARELTVPLHGENGPGKVTIKAIYNEVAVYFLLLWKDEKIDRNCVCRFEEPGQWRMHQGEDAAMLLFAPSEVTGAFREHGLDAFIQEGKFAYPGKQGFADAWYWGAQTTRPLHRARDHWMRPNQRLRGDSQPEDSDNIPNWSAQHSGPAGVPRRVGSKALSTLHWKDSIALTSERMALMKPENNIGWTVPAVLTRNMLGSRADVPASARFAGGSWFLEVARKLDTGNRDDLLLGDPMHPAHFAIAIWDGTAEGVYPGRYGVKCSRSAMIELVFLSQS